MSEAWLECNRRQMVKSALGLGMAGMLSRAAGAQSAANDRLRVAVMGLSRGMAHVECFCNIANVEVAYVCDVDRRRLAAGVKRTTELQGREPQAVEDVRRIVDDPDVDVLSIAAPNFWHAPAMLLACGAGKHVYVEKPGSHNAGEAEWMAQAARKHQRKVQLGVQRRSMPLYIEAMEKLRSGAIGSLRYARCWYNNARGSIGNGQRTPVPDWLNYDLWQGPAPRRPFKDNLVHYNWHWHWHYGNGELGNNGVHALDIARWGLNVDRPLRVNCLGGRYHFQDDQETPDTTYAIYDFGHCGISWDGSSCLPRRDENHPFVSFYGDEGTLAISDAGYDIHDPAGKKVAGESGRGSQQLHFQNFVDAIRKDTPLAAAIEDTHHSAMLCHLGNIAYRLTVALEIDPDNGRIVELPEAERLWQREYEADWKPTV